MNTTHDDLRLTDIYRVRDSHTGDVLSTHSTFRAALTAAAGEGSHKTHPVVVVEELIDGRWVSSH